MNILLKTTINELISPIIAVNSAIITYKPFRGDVIVY